MAKQQPINHDAEKLEDALGIDLDALQHKWESLTEKERQAEAERGGSQPSKFIEFLEKNFTKREIAFLFLMEKVQQPSPEEILSQMFGGGEVAEA